MSNEKASLISRSSFSNRELDGVPTNADSHGHVNHESLDYDTVDNWIVRKEERSWTKIKFRRRRVLQWLVTFIIGVATGIVAFLIDAGVTTLSSIKFKYAGEYLDSDSVYYGALIFIAFALMYASVAGSLVSFVEKVAAGSGIPEIKCYLNGIRIPRVIRLKTLCCKAFGVLFSVASGLAVGKEGPMIHSGAAIAAGISQGKSSSLPFINTGFLKAFRNDQAKRDFVSGGAAAGVAAAFGAPVGGVLFSLEEGASFWNQELTWRTLFCSMVSTFTLNFFLSGSVPGGTWGKLSEPGLISFGSFDNQAEPGYTVIQIPFFLMLGVVGGLLGALFNFVNMHLTLFRTKYLKNIGYRIFIEVLIVALTTAVVSYLCTSHIYTCQPLNDNDTDLLTDSQLNCPDGEFSDMGSLFFCSAEDAIKHLFHAHSSYTWVTLLIFSVVYWILACWTYGIAVPSGLFVPSLLVGCAYGRLFGEFLLLWMPERVGIDPGTFALIGAASMLGGVVRMTMFVVLSSFRDVDTNFLSSSLTVILMESTNDITYGLPIMLTLMVAKWVGDIFNEGLYDIHIELKKIQFLHWEPPLLMRKFYAENVMNKPVISLNKVSSVTRIVKVLEETSHNGFPIADAQNRFVGLILRSQLITLLQKRDFLVDSNPTQNYYQLATRADFEKNYPRCPGISSVSIEMDELDMFVDLRPYMNPVPFSIQKSAPLTRVFLLFRTMGLRHLVVVDVDNQICGMVTRENICHLEEHAAKLNAQTVDEFNLSINSLFTKEAHPYVVEESDYEL